MPNTNSGCYSAAHAHLNLINFTELTSFLSSMSLIHLVPAAAAANRLRILPGLARGPAAAADGRPRRLPPEGGPEPPRVQPRGPKYDLYR